MKKGNSKGYLYLMIIMLVALILAGFIKPLMEGFREGADTKGTDTGVSDKEKQSPTCAPDFTLDDKNMCVSKKHLKQGDTCPSLPNYAVFPGKCIYDPTKPTKS